ncbi:MAG TPA: hypothetical protein VHO28_11990, partial [Ignavibacteriales bacterium]|nr:hypothetical protein [Ignavibacteriales bacterium]
AGTQYPYSTANAGVIDLHMRKSGTNYNFYSPKSVQGAPAAAKITKLALLGSGEDVFAKTTDLTEPNLDEINIQDENVYLLKVTEADSKVYYVKVYVTNLSTTGTYATAVFSYKVQPVDSFKVLKQ